VPSCCTAFRAFGSSPRSWRIVGAIWVVSTGCPASTPASGIRGAGDDKGYVAILRIVTTARRLVSVINHDDVGDE